MNRKTVVAIAPATRSPLSPAVRSGNLVFVSGQTAAEATGLEAQARAVLDKIADVLSAAGCEMRDVLRCGVYLTDIRHRDRMNAVYTEYFPTDPPARTTIECKLADPAILIEIDCVAVAR